LAYCGRRNIPSCACISLILNGDQYYGSRILLPFQRCRSSSTVAIAAPALESRILLLFNSAFHVMHLIPVAATTFSGLDKNAFADIEHGRNRGHD
jgi:hypothetical protein